ncbi:type I-E CRISPR-associated protein Cse2/CasB [Streptomyces microflavus]|uniref:type I-E CRISPR-associated protein Cse2/CasB n=1 Tax=Streptomyces microflavus TaxID=1919 RepID=UPI00224FA8E8|nr:type I-E CRISPR-associated protein Cse2/CasB [Streptomyces microflavus]MCX4657352.1 type I-E CRISPR-associated protein Cse2/CasB [Streptomyces microflavus]
MKSMSGARNARPAVGRRARRYLWEEAAQNWQAARDEGRSPEFSEYIARSLRALREGVGQEPGTVAPMRAVHRVVLPDDGSDRLPDAYVAEHYTLTLFGLHQHAASDPVHQPGTGLGTACLRLRQSDTLTQAAAERRLTAAATAQDLHELAQHLQQLMSLLRSAGIGLDYTRLFRDLTRWDGPDRNRVLRAWGLQYTDPASAAPLEGDANGTGSAAAPYWTTFDSSRREAGAELAALRSGAGREAGTVPAMWTLHTTRMASQWRDKGSLTRDLVAEHAALTLFARHQQTHAHPMHVRHNSPGTAAGQLAKKGTGSAGEGKSVTAASERRFGALLTSADTDELVMHLRSLVPLLNKASIGLDYTLLRSALRVWDDPRLPDAVAAFRQRWDRDFHIAMTS